MRAGTILLSFFLGFVLLLGVGCMPSTYQIQRAALVSPPAPPMWSGKTRPSGFAMGNSTVVWKNPPEKSELSDSGLYVASTQFDGTIHIDLGPTGTVSLWIPMSYGFKEASFAAADCLVSRPDRGVFTGGIGVGASFPLSSMWYLGTSLETSLAFIPTHIEAHCVANCNFNDADVDKIETDAIPVIRWSLTGGLDLGFMRIFAGIGLRNHPTNTQLDYDWSYIAEDIDAEVQFGPIYGTVGGGVEIDLGDVVSVLAQIYQPFPLYRDDLIYGPIAGITLDLHMGR